METKQPIYLYSAETLQKWNRDTPWETGIGGSETAHIEMHAALEKRDLNVQSFAPLEIELPHYWKNWQKSEKLPLDKPGILINYRDAALYDNTFAPGYKHWFIAQDCDYAWTDERLAKIDRYICLCTEHSKYTLHKYPQLQGRVFQSTNGVRSDHIRKKWHEDIERFPNRVIYASSPDRGLKLLLEQWWRIRERVPNAELKIAYGFENMDKIISAMGGAGELPVLKAHLEKLFTQPGVEWMGRLPQDKLYDLWFSSSIWAYGSDWPETSCITGMDAQACGVYPVATKFWANAENINPEFGYLIDGLPQKDNLSRAFYIEQIITLLSKPPGTDFEYILRGEMAEAALTKFDWKKVADQFEKWIEKDSE